MKVIRNAASCVINEYTYNYLSPGPHDNYDIAKVTGSSSHRNLVNSIAPEPLNGYGPKLT